MLELALRTYLLRKMPIAGLVGTKIYVGSFVPLHKKDMPAICIEADPQERLQNIDGTPVPMQFPQFDIVVKSQQFETSIKIAELIAAAFRSISLGGFVFTAAGTVQTVSGFTSIIGLNTAWDSSLVGKTIKLQDHTCATVYSGTVTAVASPTELTVAITPTISSAALSYDIPSATAAVQIVQVDDLGSWNETEQDEGHALTSKSHVLKVRVGWIEDVSTI